MQIALNLTCTYSLSDLTEKEAHDEALGCVVLPYDINPTVMEVPLSDSGDSDKAEQLVDDTTTAVQNDVCGANVPSPGGVSSAEVPTASDAKISNITITNADVPCIKVPTDCDVSNVNVFNADDLFFESSALTVMLTMPSHPLSAMSAMPRFPMPMSTLSLMSVMPRSSLSVVIAMLRSPVFAVRSSPLSVMMDEMIMMTKAVVMISNDKSNGKPGEEKVNSKNVNESVESKFSDEESKIVNEDSDASDEDSNIILESNFSREEGEATDWESDFDENVENDQSDSDASDDEIVSSSTSFCVIFIILNTLFL